MKKLLLTLLLAAIPTYAQVQLGKNVQIGAGGTGSGNVSGQANGIVPLATGTTTIGAQSHLSDNGTTVTSTEPIAVNAGSQGGTLDATEGTPATATAGHDVLYGDATTHQLKLSNNGGAFGTICASGIPCAHSYTTITPAPLTNTNVVGAGDSRMAGSAVSAGQDFLTYLAAQPQFASRATFYNGAVSGATCSSMTSVYAANVQPHKPSGGITTAYLMIEEGINDIGGAVALATLESCYSSYVSAAVADGFTPVIFTVYYWTGATDAQETARQTFNQWLRTNFGPAYMVIEMDALVPPSTGSPYFIDSLHFNAIGNQYWAQATNFLWGLGKSGTNFFTSMERDNFTPINGNVRWYTNLVIGQAQLAGMATGEIMSSITATAGQIDLGADRNCYLLRNSGATSLLNTCGPITLDNVVTTRGLIAAGTAFTVTGCGTATNLKGGPNAGQFTGASTTCNPVITPGYTAPNGFSCHANDFTTNITFRQTATTTTTATMTSSGTAGATDTINFECIAY